MMLLFQVFQYLAGRVRAGASGQTRAGMRADPHKYRFWIGVR